MDKAKKILLKYEIHILIKTLIISLSTFMTFFAKEEAYIFAPVAAFWLILLFRDIIKKEIFELKLFLLNKGE